MHLSQHVKKNNLDYMWYGRALINMFFSSQKKLLLLLNSKTTTAPHIYESLNLLALRVIALSPHSINTLISAFSLLFLFSLHCFMFLSTNYSLLVLLSVFAVVSQAVGWPEFCLNHGWFPHWQEIQKLHY